MFNLGSGTTLGLLTCLGYGVFLLGAVYFWRCRQEFSFWFDNEVSVFRKNLSRYVPSGPFYERRATSRLVVIPTGFVHTVAHLPQRRFSGGALLLILGVLLFALDFFI
ncbi:MAG TPA: hypothetical protein VII25_05730 [Candidatus Acidoferrum sp.]|jgi:hypothetical protein